MAQRITLEEIARAAKVSPATVSRAINKTGQVAPEAERRIRAAMARLGCGVRDASRPHTLCFLLGNRAMLHPFHARLLFGAQEFASEHDSHLLFYSFNYDPSAPSEDLRLPLLIDRRGLVDGYIVGGTNSPNLLTLLARTGVPFAVLANNVVGAWNPDTLDSVWMDDVSGAYEATQHLLNLGHRDIWFLDSPRLPTARIHQGYDRAMRDAGLEPRMVQDDSVSEQDAGYVAAKSLLASAKSFSAVVCATDSIAHGATEAIAAKGLRIPEDISIVGFGDRPEAAAMSPPLTSVWGYPDQVGRRLAEMVLKRITDPEVPPQSVVLPTRLVKRNSCGRLADQARAASEEPVPALTR